jgi:tape measure domain-containing protein
MAEIKKLYNISLIGEKDLALKMEAVNRSFDQAKKYFLDLKATLAKGGLSTSEFNNLKTAVENARLETIRLNQERIKLTNDGRALNNVLKQERIDRISNNSVLKLGTSEYKEQSATLRKLKDDAKSVNLVFGEQSEQFKKAAEAANLLDSKLKAVDKSVGDNQRNVGNYPKILQSLKNNISQVVLGFVGFQAAMNAVSEITNRAVEFDSVNTAIASVSKETGDFSINQKFLTDTTERLGLKLLDTSNSFKLFFAASTQSGISAEATRKIFESASEASATMKLSQEATNGVMLAFGQIASKGKVQAEELRGQIGERIPGAFGIAAKAMNVTTAELDKMMKDGKLMSEDFLPKFAEQLKKTYGAGVEPVKGLRAEINRLDNFISKVANNKNFINFISVLVSALFGLASVITGIPFAWWIGMVGFLTLAYWQNITAIYAVINAYVAKIVVKAYYNALQAIGNALILAATILEYAQAVSTGILTGAKWLLIVAMNALGVSTAVVEGAFLLLNATFLSTPIGWLVAGILAISVVTNAYVNQVESATKKLKAHGEVLKQTASQIRVNAEIEKKANESTAERIAKLKVLTQIAGDSRNADSARKKAIEELIAIDGKYAEAMSGNIIRTGKLNQITRELTESIKQQAKAEAGRNLLVEKQKQILLNEQKQADLRPEADKLDTRKNKIGFTQGAKAIVQSVGKSIGIGSGTAAEQLSDLYDENKKLQEDVDTLAGIVVKDTTDNSITKNQNQDKKNNKASSLSGAEKDFLRDVNASRDAELAELKKAKLEGLVTEEEFLIKSLNINVKYNNAILGHFKGVDAITRKLRADTATDSIDKQIETNAKIFKIQEDTLNQTLASEKAIAQAKLDEVNNNPYSTNVDKVEAEKVFYESVLEAQVGFNIQMDILEKSYKLESKKNAEDRKNLVLKEESDLNKKKYELSKATFENAIKVVDDTKTILKNDSEILASKERTIILGDKTLSQKAREIKLERERLKLALENANIELGSINATIKLYELRQKTQKLTNDELERYNELLKQKQLLEEGKAVVENDVKTKGKGDLALPSDSTTQNLIKEKLSKSYNLDEGESNLLGNVIASSFDLATQSMNNYFDSERQNIEASKKLAYDQIDLEKKRLLSKAQSTAEKESIEKQAQAKKDKADKEAHEKLKKIKKQELSIAFAMQLANIAVAAASNPTNGVTFGVSGAIMYGALAAIATAGYLLNLSNINKQQFGQGGNIPTKGGQFIGNSHANGGIPVGLSEFEGEELAIINKKSAQSNKVYSVTGTPKQIASGINEIGGGVSFASGAIFKKYATGGYFGSSVQPPVFRSYYQNTTSKNNSSDNYQSDRLDKIEKMIIATNQTLSREVHRKTVISSKEISSFQKNDFKQSEIATL